jgi:EpsI family protein
MLCSTEYRGEALVSRTRHIIVLLLFAAAAALVGFSNIERKVQSTPVDLSAIPKDIGEWHMASENSALGKFESTFLDVVLVRTYQRKDGKVIMLAVVFGADQRKNFSIHLPEICYKSAGYDVTSLGYAEMQTPGLKLKQLLMKNAALGTEPVQYWIVLDGQVVTSKFEHRLRQLYYGLWGAQASGVLVRVSSSSTDRALQEDLAVQKEFITALYKSLDPELKRLLFGAVTHE